MHNVLNPHLLILLGDQISQSTPTEKAFEAAVSFSQSLSQWAYIVVGGTVALLFKDLKARPDNSFVRHSYWAFAPGWAALVLSIYQGIRVQEAYIAYLMNPSPSRDNAVIKFNLHTARQIGWMEAGLGLFALWLIVVLAHWILHKEATVVGAEPDEC